MGVCNSKEDTDATLGPPNVTGDNNDHLNGSTKKDKKHTKHPGTHNSKPSHKPTHKPNPHKSTVAIHIPKDWAHRCKDPEWCKAFMKKVIEAGKEKELFPSMTTPKISEKEKKKIEKQCRGNPKCIKELLHQKRAAEMQKSMIRAAESKDRKDTFIIICLVAGVLILITALLLVYFFCYSGSRRRGKGGSRRSTKGGSKRSRSGGLKSGLFGSRKSGSRRRQSGNRSNMSRRRKSGGVRSSKSQSKSRKSPLKSRKSSRKSGRRSKSRK